MSEVWRKPKSVPAKSDNYYEISSLGNVRHIKNGRTIDLKPFAKRRKNGTVLNVIFKSFGVNYSVAREVYRTFIGEIPEGCAVVHKDLNKRNNAAHNLRVMPRKGLAKVYGQRSSVRKELKTVVRINAKGEILDFYRGLNEAARRTSLSTHSVRNRCIGKIADIWLPDGTTLIYEDDAENFIAKMC